MSFVIINDFEKYDLSLLVKFSGGDPSETNNFIFNTQNNMLTVHGVDQDTLEQSLLDYFELYEIEMLEPQKDLVLQRIDSWIGEQRKAFITVAFGQEMVYYDKVDQAADYIAMNYPDDLTNYPFIKLESEITGKEPHEVVELILNKKREWSILNSKLERLRLKSKFDVKNAKTTIEIEQIYNKLITTPLE